jgi:hypothetical protein
VFELFQRKENDDKGNNFTHTNITIEHGKDYAAFLGDIFFNGVDVTGYSLIDGRQRELAYMWIGPDGREVLKNFVGFIEKNVFDYTFSVSTTLIDGSLGGMPYRYMVRLNLYLKAANGQEAKLYIRFDAKKYRQLIKVILESGWVCLLFEKPVGERSDMPDLLPKLGQLSLNILKTEEVCYPYIYKLLDDLEKGQLL